MAIEAGTASVVAESWTRCRDAGLCPESCDLRRLPPEEAARRLAAGGPLLRAAALHARRLSRALGDSPHAVCVSDREGLLVCVSATWGGEIGMEDGCDWSEPARGTNAVGTAIVADREIVCAGADHFARALHEVDGVAAPLHGSDGRVAGALAVVGPRPSATPDRLALVALAAREIERAPEQFLPTLAAGLRDRLATLLLYLRGGMPEAALGAGRKLTSLLARLSESRERGEETGDAATLLRTLAERARPEAMKRGVMFEIAAAEGISIPAKAGLALESILESAVRATGPGAIRVEAGREGQGLRISIRAPGGVYSFDFGYQLALHEIEAHGGEVRVRPGLVEILI